MSTDERVTTDLIETLKDGKDGFAHAADQLVDSDRSDLAPVFRELSDQRGRFATELEQMAAAYGDDIDEDGSVAASVHRAWMSVRDALSGSDPKGVLQAAEQGEDHAVSEYEKALEEDISADLRRKVERQLIDIRQAHSRVKNLSSAA